jgi:hypothetical protein
MTARNQIDPINHPGRVSHSIFVSRPSMVRRALRLACAACLLLTFAAAAHAQTLAFSTAVDTTSAPQSGGNVLVVASLPNQTDYDSFSPPVISGPAARFYSISSNTCIGQVTGPFICMVGVVFSPTFVPPSGQTLNATLTVNYQACEPGPTNCAPATATNSLVGTVTGSNNPPPAAQIQILPTKPALVQSGSYGPELAVDPNGNVYASINNNVVEFTSTQAFTPGSTPTVLANINAYGITYFGGYVYAVEAGAGVVERFTASGAPSLAAGEPGMTCRAIDQTYHIGSTTQGVGCYDYQPPVQAMNGNPATPATAGFFNPTSLATDGFNLFISDTGSDTVRMKNIQSDFSNAAGYAGTPFMYEGYPTNQIYPGFSGDGGAGNAAQVNGPAGMAVDSTSNLFVADEINNVVRKIDISGTITTFLGQGPGVSGSFSTGEGDGPAGQATLSVPVALTFDAHGDLYIVDQLGYDFREVSIDSSGNPAQIKTLYSLAHSGLPPVTLTSGTPVIDSTGEMLFSSYFNLPQGTYSAPTPPSGIYEILGSGFVQFPTVEVGVTSAQTVTITNPGTANLTISGATLAGANPNDFTVTANTCTSPVQGGSSCTLTVTFSPTTQYSGNARAAEIDLATNVGSSQQVIVLNGMTYAQPALTQGRIFVPYYNWPEPSLAVAAVTASGGVPPYTFTYSIPSSSGNWYLSSGTTTASIDGTPIQVGPISYTITVTDSEGGTVSFPGSFTVAQAPSSLQLSSSSAPSGAMTAVSVSGFMNPGEQLNPGTVDPTGYVQMALDNGQPQNFAINASGVVQRNQFNIDVLFHTLTANYAGDTNYLALSFPSTLTYNGNRAQSITFYGGLSAPNGSTIPLTAYANSGLPVTYGVSGPGSIDSTHVQLVLSGTGNVQVTATQAGNSSFAAATSVTATFTSY